MPTYKIVRHFANSKLEKTVIKTGLTEEEAIDHCNNLETSSTSCSSPGSLWITEQYGAWFDSYTEEE